MERWSERWQLHGVSLLLAAAFMCSVALALAGFDWGWRTCAAALGIALGYGSAYLVASRAGGGQVLRVMLGLLAVAVFGVSFYFFVGFDTIGSAFLYGLGFALLTAVFRGLASR